MNRPFNVDVRIISEAGSVIFNKKNLAGYMFTNIGAVNCYVNKMVAYPGTPGSILGDSRTVSGHDGDFYVGELNVSFDAGAGALCELSMVFYADVFE